MRVAVVGTGHVGLVTCVTMAELGHQVVGLDSDPEKVEQLSAGHSWFWEPGLEELLAKSLGNGTLTFTTEIEELPGDLEVAFICVGTPARVDGEANLLAVELAARQIARHATGPMVIVEKSTTPAGTSCRVKQAITRERPDLAGSIEVVSNPEFLREGSAVEDSLHPDRILVGAETESGFAAMRKLYSLLLEEGTPIFETDIATAELAKHACNAFLALKISYANALARICERAGADVTAIAEVMGADARIGRSFLNAGLGYGGFCFPKDLVAFERLSSRLGYDFTLLKEVAKINDEAVDATLDKIGESLWNFEGKRVALFGLAFKAQTDDVRYAPALALARKLLDREAEVVGYDPEAGANAKEELPGLELTDDPYEAARGADCVVLCTEWPEFRELDLARLKEVMSYPLVVDGRNFLSESKVTDAGLVYVATGRPQRTPVV